MLKIAGKFFQKNMIKLAYKNCCMLRFKNEEGFKKKVDLKIERFLWTGIKVGHGLQIFKKKKYFFVIKISPDQIFF